MEQILISHLLIAQILEEHDIPQLIVKVFPDAILSFAREEYIEQNNVKHMCKSFWKKVELKIAGRGPSVVPSDILCTIWMVFKASPYNKM